METIVSLVVAVLGVIAALIGRKKVIEHRHVVATTNGESRKPVDLSAAYRFRRIGLLALLALGFAVAAEVCFRSSSPGLGAALGSLTLLAGFGMAIHFFVWFFSLFK